MAEHEHDRTSPWRTLTRLWLEALQIAFFAGLHWGLKWLVKGTGQEAEWWAPVVLQATAIFFIIQLVVVAGAELWVTCLAAIRFAAGYTRKGAPDSDILDAPSSSGGDAPAGKSRE